MFVVKMIKHIRRIPAVGVDLCLQKKGEINYLSKQNSRPPAIASLLAGVLELK